jgi:WD40 repeat protein
MFNGGSFAKDLGFEMVDQSAITGMSCDIKSQTLAVGNSNGFVIIFECDNQTEWKPVHSINPQNEIPVTAVDTLIRGSENLYAVGFANGLVKLIHPNGHILCELSAHSRSLNALVCHPSKPIFSTCSDDTFVHVFKVSGEASDKIDVNLHLGSRVND